MTSNHPSPPVAPFLVPPPPFARHPLMKLSSASWSVPQAGEHYKGRSISLAGAGAGKKQACSNEDEELAF